MSRAVILISLAAVAMAQEEFFEKYTFTKVMANCFGEDAYYDYLAKVGIAQRECQQFPVSSLHSVDYTYYSKLGYPVNAGGQALYHQYPTHYLGVNQQHYGIPQTYPQYHYLKKRQAEGGAAVPAEEPAVAVDPPKQPFFDQYYILDSVNKVMASLSNYTCTLHKLGLIDEYLNLHAANYVELYNQLPISDGLKKDLADGINHCVQLTYCLPLERLKSPLPLNLQYLLMAMKCEKETRTDACFKDDLRKNIDEFDLSLFPEDDTDESKLNKLSAIVIESDSLNELEIL
ncbi:uncharacterized protein [Macrobrachium rosenbergii]|uniref:uncharacterized protein n=1 Tax=Macrobrachium rosenbergii TaxID=79674 RepID=UPI0034D6B31A